MLIFFLIETAAALAAMALVYAESSDYTQESRPTYAPNKTSDRTPGNPLPDRTPGASAAGAGGTEIAKSPDGASDLTPSNHDKLHAY